MEILQHKKRQKRVIPIDYRDAPYEKSIQLLKIVQAPETFNIIDLLAQHDPLTEAEILSVTTDKMYFVNVQECLQQLIDNGIVIKAKGVYELDIPTMKYINTTLKTIGKYARN